MPKHEVQNGSLFKNSSFIANDFTGDVNLSTSYTLEIPISANKEIDQADLMAIKCTDMEYLEKLSDSWTAHDLGISPQDTRGYIKVTLIFAILNKNYAVGTRMRT